MNYDNNVPGGQPTPAPNQNMNPGMNPGMQQQPMNPGMNPSMQQQPINPSMQQPIQPNGQVNQGVPNNVVVNPTNQGLPPQEPVPTAMNGGLNPNAMNNDMSLEGATNGVISPTNINNQPNGVPPMNPGMNPETQQPMNMGNNLGSSPDSKKKKGFLPIIIIVVLLVLVAGGLFAYKTISSSPKKIFQTTIKDFYKGISTTLNEVELVKENFDDTKNALTFSFDTSIDANFENFENAELLNKLSAGASIGLDSNTEEALISAFIKGEKEKMQVDGFYTDGKTYFQTNLIDGLYYTDGNEIDIDFDSITNAISEYKEIMPSIDDIDYLVEAVTNAVSDSLDSEFMSKESEKISVDGNEGTYNKYIYKLNKDSFQKLVKNTLEKLKNDNKFIKILADTINEETDYVIEQIDDMIDEVKDIETDPNMEFIVYTKGLFNKFAGISILVEKEEVLSYVDDGTNFELNIYEGEDKITVTGNRKESETIIKSKVSEDFEFTITIKSLAREKIDVSFSATINEETISGSIYLTFNESSNKIDGEYKVSVDYEDYYAKVFGNYKVESADKLDIPSTNGAKSIDELDEDKLYEALEEKTKKDDLFNAMFEDAIKSYSYEKNDLNNYGMKEVYFNSDFAPVLTEPGTSVLYYGTTYYFSSEEAEKDFFETLVDLQEELGFYSYYISSISDEEILAFLETATPTCSVGEECLQEPIMYIVKDGVIINAISAPSSESEMRESLANAGIK